jgi:drug/metabolite transporter (DMT)-like permease
MLFRNFFALLLLTPWLMSVEYNGIKSQHIRLHFARALLGIMAMCCLYYAWGLLPLAHAALLKQTAPFFIPLIAFFWLAEKVNRWVVVSIFMGFIGVYFVLDPHSGEINFVVLVALIWALLGAFAKVTIRKLTKSEASKVIVFYFCLFATGLALLPAVYFWQALPLQSVAWLFALALAATVAQLLLSKTYALTKAGELAPSTYTSVFYGVIFGWIIWNETTNSLRHWLYMQCGNAYLLHNQESTKIDSF